MKRILIGWLIVWSCFLLGTAPVFAAADLTCAAVNYCETELKLSDQKAPIVYDGSGDWLNEIEKYFDIDVQLVDGKDKAPLTDAKLIYACSSDGLTFDSCQQGAFVEIGTYTLRVSVEADDSRYYLPVYADTKVTISDAAELKGLTIQYFDEGAVSGTPVEDWETYQAGDSAIILGNFGIDESGNPDPLVRPGYELIGWREAKGVREFSFGDTVVMKESLNLLPIWSDAASGPAAAGGDAVSAPMSLPITESRAEAPSAGGVQFFPVRSDGDRSDPVLLSGAKTIATVTYDSDAAGRPSARVLDGFFTPDGEETRLIIRRSEANSQPVSTPAAAQPAAEEAPSPMAKAAETLSEPVAAEPTEMMIEDERTDPLIDNPFETDAEREPLAESGSESASMPVEAAIPTIENVLGTVSSAANRAADETQAVPFALPTPVAKQLAAPNNQQANQDWDGFAVRLPETGLRLTGDEAVEPLDRVGMILELPAYGVRAEIVVVPFAGDTWDVRRLRDEAGVLEGFDLPGEGVSILAGHNHLGTDEAGPFQMVGLAEIGDRIFVHRADGTLLMFEVYENMLVEPNEFGTIEALSIANPGSIVLVTCENETVDGGYSHRRAVFAKPIPE